MAEIKDCIGQKIKIGKNSITIKNDFGRTCGVITNVTSFENLQPNKRFVYYHQLRELGIWGKISVKECMIKDDTLYVFRNIHSKLHYEKYGYITEEEKARAEQKEILYNTIKASGINVIECIVL